MFTGIVTAIGTIQSAQELVQDGQDGQYGRYMEVAVPTGYLADVNPGDSIAINGACMTVTAFDAAAAQPWFGFEISAESLNTIAPFALKQRVNLEKALAAHDRLGGHILSGHVDTTGTVQCFEPVGESWELRVAVDRAFAKFMAYKGSAGINGTSLTVNAVEDTDTQCIFSINLIPHTVENTTLGDLRAGSTVNVEVDVIARYCERMLSLQSSESSEG